jgi:gas vesicle protein GvpL/GvpF
MLYAYGAVRPGQLAPAVKGIDGAAVAILEAGGLAVAVSELPREITPTRDRLVQHHRVTMALLRGGGVAPFRFGNVFPGEAELRQGLQKRTSELERKLEALAGCVEMAVRQPLPPAGKPRSGTDYLLAKRRRLLAGEQLRAKLGDVVKDWRQEDRRDSLELACLVPAGQVAEFQDRLEHADPSVEVSGPWPPSSFV